MYDTACPSLWPYHNDTVTLYNITLCDMIAKYQFAGSAIQDTRTFLSERANTASTMNSRLVSITHSTTFILVYETSQLGKDHVWGSDILLARHPCCECRYVTLLFLRMKV